MALDSDIISCSSARKWVERISNVFKIEAAIEIDHLPPVCVFHVPKTLTSQNPEAYAPQLIGMGPYHHLRSDLYQMERFKLLSIKEILKPGQIHTFQQCVIDALKQMDAKIRACYNNFMDYDEDTLAWIMAIDSVFLINLLSSLKSRHEVMDNFLAENSLFIMDIMMLENQIPVILLKQVRKLICSSSLDVLQDDHDLFSLLLVFCEAYSPLRITTSDVKISNKLSFTPRHLLDLMHHLIVNGHGMNLVPMEDITIMPAESAMIKASDPSCSKIPPNSNEEGLKKLEASINMENIFNVVEAISSKKAQNFLKPIKVITSMPWSTISGLFRKGTKFDKDYKNPLADEIAIPSVEHLSRYAQVKCLPIHGSINNIKFVKEEATLFLPIITLNSCSEVILRNLVAYEAAMSRTTLEFARYVNLMNGIIDTPEDAKILRQNGVVKGDLNDEEIADLFNGMRRSFVRPDQKSNVEIAIQSVNNYYDEKRMAGAYRRIKRKLCASWKFLAAVLLLLMLGLQSFCDAYSCSKFWNSIAKGGGGT